MKEVNYNGGKLYIDDSEVPVEETGVFSLDMEDHEEELEKTRKINLNINEEDLLLDTVVDLWDDTDGN